MTRKPKPMRLPMLLAALLASAAILPAQQTYTRDDADQLISVACDVDITQLVDTNSGVHVLCPKSIFTHTNAP